MSIVDNRTLLSLADSNTGWFDFGLSAAALETDTIIEGTGSIGETIDNTSAFQGTMYDIGGGADGDFSGNHVYFWFNMAAAGLIDTFVARATASAGSGNYVERAFASPNVNEELLAYSGGWIPIIVSVDKLFNFPTRADGTIPSATSFRYIGLGCKLIAGAMPKKQDNFFIDASWRLPANTPAIVVEGGTYSWQDLIDWSAANANGLLLPSVDGDYVLRGPMQIGADEATTSPAESTTFFDDTGKIINFSQDDVDEDFFKITVTGMAGATTNAQIGAVVGTGDNRQGVGGGIIRASRQPFTIDAESDISQVSSVAFYGVTLEGCKQAQFSSNSKTSLVGVTARDCGEIQINDADVLNYTQVAPRNRGLELLTTHDLKNGIFIAGTQLQKPGRFGSDTLFADAGPSNPVTFSHTVPSGGTDVALLVLIGLRDNGNPADWFHAASYNGVAMLRIASFHRDETNDSVSLGAFILFNPPEDSSLTVSVETQQGAATGIFAFATQLEGVPPEALKRLRLASDVVEGTALSASVTADNPDAYSIDFGYVNDPAPGGSPGFTADGDQSQITDGAVGTDSSYFVGENTGPQSGARTHSWSWTASHGGAMLALLFEDLVPEHHIHLPENASPDFGISFDNLKFFGFDTSASPDLPGYNDKWHGEASGGTDITIQASNGANPIADLFEVPGSEVVTVINTVTLTVTCLDPDGNGIAGVRVRIERASDGSLIAQGETDSAGQFSDSSFNFVSDTPVLVKARLKGYLPIRTNSTITTDGLSIPFTLQLDTIVNLP